MNFALEGDGVCSRAAVPGPWMRQNRMARAGGHPFEAYLVAVKEFPQ